MRIFAAASTLLVTLTIGLTIGLPVGLTVGFAVAAAPATFPGIQPQLAAIENRVYLAYGLGDSISVARSDDSGETFGLPTRLPVSGKLSLGMHRGPRVAATGSTVLVSAVVGAKGGGADGDVVLLRSSDRGVSWAQPVTINDVPGSAREGLHAMTASPTGLVVIAWLDLRDKGTRVYASVSRDYGVTWMPDSLVYTSPSGSVCECCHPSIAIDGGGRIAIMFRNNVDGNRDMYVATSASGGRFDGATKLGATSWLLNACPMDGGGLAFNGKGANGGNVGNAIIATWRRDDGVFVSTGQVAERRVGTGRDPAIATVGAERDLAWSGSAGIMLMRGAGQPVAISPGRFPVLLAFKNKTILAWEHQGSVEVRALPR